MPELLERILGEVETTPDVLDPEFVVNRIVPYPYGSNIGLIGREAVPYLSKLSRASIDAAAVVWRAHPDSQVVLIGETPYGEDFRNTTDLMLLRGRARGIDEDAFVPISELPNGKPLNNTYSQTEALARYVSEAADDGTELVLGLDYHLRRVARTVRAYRRLRQADFATVESVLWADKDHSYDRYLPFTQALHEKDLKLEAINLFDRRGRILSLAARLLGANARVVDVIENDDGELELEDDFAIPKLERLLAQAGRQTDSAPENG